MSALERQTNSAIGGDWPGGPDVIGYTVTTPAGNTIGRVEAMDLDSVFVTRWAGRLGRRETETRPVSWTYVAWVDPFGKNVLPFEEGAELLTAA